MTYSSAAMLSACAIVYCCVLYLSLMDNLGCGDELAAITRINKIYLIAVDNDDNEVFNKQNYDNSIISKTKYSLLDLVSPTENLTPNDNDSDRKEKSTDLLTVHNKKVFKQNKKRRKSVLNSRAFTAKQLRNSGSEYISASKSGKLIPAREIKPPCDMKCRFKCFMNINEEQRQYIFKSYWKMGSLIRQRYFIARSMTVIQPRYQYKRLYSTRSSNNAFHFTVNGKIIRVCKLFFINTLGVSERVIRTVKEKMTDNGTVEEDKRGKHGKQKRLK